MYFQYNLEIQWIIQQNSIVSFQSLRKSNARLHLEPKSSGRVKAILRHKNTAGSTTILNLKIHCRTITKAD